MFPSPCFRIEEVLVSPLTFAGVGKTVIAAFDYKRFKQRHLRPAFSWLRTEKRFWSRASECQEAYQITAEILSGVPIHTMEDAEKATQVLLDKGVSRVFLSMGAEGVYAADHTRKMLLKNLPGKRINTTGCGDAFMAALKKAIMMLE